MIAQHNYAKPKLAYYIKDDALEVEHFLKCWMLVWLSKNAIKLAHKIGIEIAFCENSTDLLI